VAKFTARCDNIKFILASCIVPLYCTAWFAYVATAPISSLALVRVEKERYTFHTKATQLLVKT
jgi:hypothetical protein